MDLETVLSNQDFVGEIKRVLKGPGAAGNIPNYSELPFVKPNQPDPFIFTKQT